MAEKRYRTPSPVETPRRAKATRLTRSVTSSAKMNSFPSQCVCNESPPASGLCQFCDPVNSHSIADNEGGLVEDSDDGIQQQPASQVSSDIGSPRVCLNKNCDYPLPQHYPYRSCQSCLTAYRERYRDGKLACKGRCGTRIPRSSRSPFCPSCRKSASPTKKSGNGKTRASIATKRCRTYSRCGNELPLSHQYKSCDPCRKKNREYKRALIASKAHEKANNADEVVEEVAEEEDEVEILDQVEVHAAKEVVKLSDNSEKETEVEALMNELQAQRNQLSRIAQEDIAEYAHLNILNRLLQETKEDFVQDRIPREGIIRTFDNLASQIAEAANRRLEHIPVGFDTIMGIMGIGNAGKSNEGEVAGVHHSSQTRQTHNS